MKRSICLLPLAFASCATVTPGASGGKECYRYVNTLDFANDNSLDPVTVIGYDESGQKEATRLDVTVGTATLSLHDPYDGSAGGAMYHPAVKLKSDGALVVTWEQIGEVKCRSEIVADASGKLVERSRSSRES